MTPPTRKPRAEVLRINGATHRSQYERGEGVARVWRERKLGAAEVVRARRLRLYGGVVARPCQLIADLQCVLSDDLREIVLQRKVFTRLIRATHGAHPVPEVEYRERQRGYV